MTKNYPKKQPKKVKLKSKNKLAPKPVSITSSKTYWLALTLMMVVFGSVYGYMMKVVLAGIGLLLASVLFIIGFAYYLRFKPSLLKNSDRATFLFIGACILGFGIWAAVILLSQRNRSLDDTCWFGWRLFLCHNNPDYLHDFRSIYRRLDRLEQRKDQLFFSTTSLAINCVLPILVTETLRAQSFSIFSRAKQGLDLH